MKKIPFLIKIRDMHFSIKLKNKIFIDEIYNTDKNIVINLNKDDNIILAIENSFTTQTEPINKEQLAELNNKLLLSYFSITNIKKLFCSY